MADEREQIRERLPIETLVGEHVALKRAGRNLKGLCPFHKENTPSFVVTPESGRFHCFGCLPPGSLIKTQCGMRPIEQIRVGELIYAGDGRLHPVLFTHERAFSGELVRLTCAPFKVPVLLTPNHKVPVLRPKSRRLVEIEAGDIRPDNFLLYPSIERPREGVSWSVLPGWDTNRGMHPRALPSVVDADAFAEWLGWYLAEGSISNNRTVRFSLGGDEIEQAQRLRHLTRQLFESELKISAIGTRIEAWFCHALLAKWLKHHCGAGSHNKRLPRFVWSWNQEQHWLLFHSLMLGDGCLRRTTMGGRIVTSWSLKLASATLIDDARDLLLMNGITPLVREERKADGRLSWYLSIRPDVHERWGTNQFTSAIPVPVRKVARIPYEGPVYNLTVADEHTYLTMSGTVCNCGSDGDIFRFYMLINKVEFPDALRALATRTGVELDPDAARKKAAEARVHEVLAAVALYFQQSLAGEAGRVARDYLATRGIRRETSDRFALGYLPDWGEGLRRELPARGVSEQELLDAAVLIPSDQGREPFSPFHGRLIFPIRDIQGRITGFGGRILGEGQPKYLNSRQTATFDKSNTLYTIERAAEAIRQSGEAVIVEGYLDALRAHQEGFGNVVASLGTAITPRQLALLTRLRGRDGAPLRIVLALDADPAGARAAAEAGLRATIAIRQSRPDPGAIALGKSSRPSLELFIATLPDGRDPDEVIAADPGIWRAAIAGAVPAMDYLFDLVLRSLNRASPTFTQDAVAALLPLIGELPGVGLQQPYLERLASVTRINTAALRGELARLRGEARRSTRQPVPRRGELAALQERAAARDPRTLVEEELLTFLLRQCPLRLAALERLDGVTMSIAPRLRLLAAVTAAHAGGAQPSGATVLSSLDGDAYALGEALLAAPALPALEAPKVPAAISQFLLRLERLEQSERLQAQADLLDQLDAETAGELLRPTQDLLARRHDLSQRMLEEQAAYHLR